MDRPASLHVGDGGGNPRTMPSVLVVPTDRSCGRKRGGCRGDLGIGEGAGNEQGLHKLSLIDLLSPQSCSTRTDGCMMGMKEGRLWPFRRSGRWQ